MRVLLPLDSQRSVLRVHRSYEHIDLGKACLPYWGCSTEAEHCTGPLVRCIVADTERIGRSADNKVVELVGWEYEVPEPSWAVHLGPPSCHALVSRYKQGGQRW